MYKYDHDHVFLVYVKVRAHSSGCGHQSSTNLLFKPSVYDFSGSYSKVKFMQSHTSHWFKPETDAGWMFARNRVQWWALYVCCLKHAEIEITAWKHHFHLKMFY